MSDIVIDEPMQGRIAKLGQDMNAVLAETTAAARRTSDIMQRALGSEFSSQKKASEFQDKYGNNVFIVIMNAEFAANAAYPRDNEGVADALRELGEWTTARSDKPAQPAVKHPQGTYPQETRPQGTRRALVQMERYIEENESRFKPEDRKQLMEDMQTLRVGLGKLTRQCEEAKKLHEALVPPVPQIG